MEISDDIIDHFFDSSCVEAYWFIHYIPLPNTIQFNSIRHSHPLAIYTEIPWPFTLKSPRHSHSKPFAIHLVIPFILREQHPQDAVGDLAQELQLSLGTL